MRFPLIAILFLAVFTVSASATPYNNVFGNVTRITSSSQSFYENNSATLNSTNTNITISANRSATSPYFPIGIVLTSSNDSGVFNLTNVTIYPNTTITVLDNGTGLYTMQQLPNVAGVANMNLSNINLTASGNTISGNTYVGYVGGSGTKEGNWIGEYKAPVGCNFTSINVLTSALAGWWGFVNFSYTTGSQSSAYTAWNITPVNGGGWADMNNTATINANDVFIRVNLSTNGTDVVGFMPAAGNYQYWIFSGQLLCSQTLPKLIKGNNTLSVSQAANSSNVFNITFSRFEPDVLIKSYDELTYAPIDFNASINNGTSSQVFQSAQQQVVGTYAGLPTGISTISISNASYYPRSYVSQIGGTGTEINAYLVPISTFSQLVRFHIQGQLQQGISGATVEIQKFIGSGWTVVGNSTTDNSGTAAYYMDVNTNYHVAVSASGYVNATYSVMPTGVDYYYSLQSGTASNFTSLYDNLTYSLTPTFFNQSNASQNITFTALDGNNLTTIIWLNLSFANGSQFYSASNTTSTGGSISVQFFQANRGPYITATTSIARTGKGELVQNVAFNIGNYSNSTYTWNNAKDNFSNAGLSDFSKGFIVLMISILGTAWVSRYAPEGYSALIGVLFLSFFGAGFFVNFTTAIMLASLVAGGWFVLRVVSRN